MRVAIFCRVSTEDQVVHGVSLKDQKKRGIEFCKSKNYDYEIFEEPAKSGALKIEERPVLFDLMKRTSKGKQDGPEYNAIFFTDFDRLTRDRIVLETLRQHFIENEILVFENGEKFDLKNETTELLVSIKGSLAAFELKKMKERIKRALERSVIDGKAGGGPFQSYGYKKGADKKLEVNENEAEVVRQIFKMASFGLGTKRIANELNFRKVPTKRNNHPKGKMTINGKEKLEFLWRDKTIYGILRNPMYCGERLFKGNKYSCPPIIDKNQFDFVAEKLKERKNFTNTRNTNSYLLKGLILCVGCKRRMFGRKRVSLKDNAYKCSSQLNNDFCGTRGISIDRLDNIVWTFIKRLPEFIEKKLRNPQRSFQEELKEKIRLIDLEIEEYESMVSALIDELTRNKKLFPIFQSKLDELAINMARAEKDKSKRERELEMNENFEEIINTIRSQIESINEEELQFEKKQMIVRQLVSVILVKWIEELQSHVISIRFRISNLADLSLIGVTKINYSKNGFIFKEKKVAFEFEAKFNYFEESIPVTNENPIDSKSDSVSFSMQSDDFVEKGFVNKRDQIIKAFKRGSGAKWSFEI